MVTPTQFRGAVQAAKGRQQRAGGAGSQQTELTVFCRGMVIGQREIPKQGFHAFKVVIS